MIRIENTVHFDAVELLTEHKPDIKVQIINQMNNDEWCYQLDELMEKIRENNENAADVFLKISVETIMEYTTIPTDEIEFVGCAEDDDFNIEYNIPLDFDDDKFIEDVKAGNLIAE